MRILFKPYNCDGDIVATEVDAIILTDDILSYLKCDMKCNNCIGIKIPGLFFGGANDIIDDECFEAFCPMFDNIDAFKEAIKTGFIDLTEHPVFSKSLSYNDLEKLTEYLDGLGILNSLPSAKCLKSNCDTEKSNFWDMWKDFLIGGRTNEFY